jgi:hypothetical protein
MRTLDLKQMQSYYWTWVTHWGENVHRRNREREEILKLECAHCRGMNKVILNWQRPLWEGDQEV